MTRIYLSLAKRIMRWIRRRHMFISARLLQLFGNIGDRSRSSSSRS